MIRTDLALEVHNRIQVNNKVQGVTVEKHESEDKITVTKIEIHTENGAREMGRPLGCYVTIDFSNAIKQDSPYEKAVSGELAQIIEQWIPVLEKKDGFTVGMQGEKEISVLVAGLGNAEEIIDALGPKVVQQIPKSRHIMNEFGKYGYGSREISRISGIAPGVRGSTGMEAQEILQGIVKETEPDLLIVIDALVGKNARRIGKTIQVTNTGIIPGSGIGLHRRAITKETMGIPVITIGVPTVVDTSYGYFLVPKDITPIVNRISGMIAAGIKMVFYE